MTHISSFDETVEQLEQLYHQPHVPAARAGLGRAGRLLAELGNPHHRFRSVHIAGSNGKGSTTAMVASVLEAQGMRTGAFRSPHLESYLERIAVDGREIEADSWRSLFAQVWPVVESMRNNALPGYALGRPTLSEVLFAMMALYFAQEGVEWAAVETGLGGRLDATNLLSSDVAVITNVSLEHTQILGSTVAEIAGEKAAIIKEGSHAVTAASDAEALSVIERRAAEVAAPLLVAGRDIAVEVLSHDVGSQRLELRGPHSAVQVDLPLAGDHQAANAAAAFGAAEALRDRGIQIDDRALKRGFEAVYAPGRFEVVSREPMIVLDGAHNPAAARALARAITSWLPGRKLVLLFAAMQDKDAESMARELGPLAEVVIVTRVPHTERAASLARLAQSFAPWHANVVVEDDADRGLEHALARVGQGSFVLVTGSMYLVGYTRRLLRTRTLAR